MLSTPDGARLDEALAGLDFMVAVDIYLNETTRHADVILPPTSALERDHYDLVFHTLAVRNTARFTPAAVRRRPRRPARLGDLPRARPRATGCRLLEQAPSAGRRLGRPPGCAPRPTRLVDLLLRTGRPGSRCGGCARTPTASTSGRSSRACPAGCATTDDQRIDLAPQLVLDDLARLAALDRADAPADELLLIGRRHQRDNNSWMHNSRAADQGHGRATSC